MVLAKKNAISNYFMYENKSRKSMCMRSKLMHHRPHSLTAQNNKRVCSLNHLNDYCSS